jgi:lysophospholipase L1-like esterase
MPGPGAPSPRRPPWATTITALAVIAVLAVLGVLAAAVPGAGAQATSTSTRAPATLAPSTTTAGSDGSRTSTSTSDTLRVRAFGDSITAGYGFFGDGAQWGITDLLRCRPPSGAMNDRCSSNSTLGPGAPAGPPAFTADFGLANNVAWPAQVATSLGVTDYANYAVTGSEPRQWMSLAPEPDQPDNGAFHDLLVRLENDDPDVVLMTLGANPLLADFLTGPGMACALFDDEATQHQLFLDCIGAVIQDNLVAQRLIAVYLDVLAHTAKAKVLVSHYYLAIPAMTLFDEWQAQAMVDSVNAQVDTAVASVKESGATFAERIAIADPARFDSGWPGTGQDAGCGAKIPADGPSHQSLYAQVMLVGRAGSNGFCVSDQPWTIDADTGIHPDRVGHSQLAAAALAVIRANGWDAPSG